MDWVSARPLSLGKRHCASELCSQRADFPSKSAQAISRQETRRGPASADRGYYPPIMENQMEQNMENENEMETGDIVLVASRE